ncbi:MAG: cysteine desulfurase [Alphaproteobacteria bacterium]|nr:cysteine desulfurase [Alphaproteobacteria bacterium]
MTVSAYLDHNAGSPARPEVVAVVADILREAGNPSSVHAAGRAARARLEAARTSVAGLVGAPAGGIIFTSGGTEANALALKGCGRPCIVASAVEHPSVLAYATDIVPVDQDGIVDLAALERLLAESDQSAIVSVMLANNETGVIQPVAEVARLAHRLGALVHCDAAQGPGRLVVSMSDLDVDFLTLSAHKMGGLPGCGALALKNPDFPMAPFLLGGGQERRRRSGSENLPGIVGFGVAADDILRKDTILEMSDLRDHLESQALARVPAARVVAQAALRLCNTTCLALPGVAAQLQVAAMDLAGLMVSAGSACSSGKVGESHVLKAMGLAPEWAGSAIRVSLGPDTTKNEIELFLNAWTDLAGRKGLDVKQAAKAA